MTQPSKTNGITLLGLGPGDPGALTREAWDVLSAADELVVRTPSHPALAGLHANLVSFDETELGAASQDQIVERVLELGRRPQGVIYAVPGHPLLDDSASQDIARQAQTQGLPVRVIGGISLLEPVMVALNLSQPANLTLLDAAAFDGAHHPTFSPSAPVLVMHLADAASAAAARQVLLAEYPPAHSVQLVYPTASRLMQVEALPLDWIDRSEHFGPMTALYIPPLAQGSGFEDFQEVVAHLRAPEGCPWDREQTFKSLRDSLLEETYEALEAIDSADFTKLEEELGDLLLMQVMYAQMAFEAGHFKMSDVIRGIYSKIVRRHPHVFGQVQVSGVSQVLQNWDDLKAQERKAKGQDESVKGLLDGVPNILPALSQAQEIQARAARVGFDWDEIEPVVAKVREELEEVLDAPDADSRAGEVGDLLFAVVNVARWYKVDAETVLRETNARFKRRFGYVESTARSQGRDLKAMTLAEMDVLWEEAKKGEA